MKGHLGAVLTSGLGALALARRGYRPRWSPPERRGRQAPPAPRQGPTNRYSAPANRSAVPWAPFDKAQPEKPVPPESPEGRTPERRQQEERRSPPPSRFRGMPPRIGPHPARKASA